MTLNEKERNIINRINSRKFGLLTDFLFDRMNVLIDSWETSNRLKQEKIFCSF